VTRESGLPGPATASTPPRVSVIMPFLDAERFIDEAIRSVLDQRFTDWELLLVDDGSTDSSTEIAHSYALAHPGKIRYLEHEGHRNLGPSTSRNLAIAHARGEYLAPLDADDIWLPNKLAEQVPLMDARPDVGMLTGRTLVWYSWTGKPADAERDHILPLGVGPNTLVPPPTMLARLLQARVRTPCPCSILLRRSVVEEVGGFEDEFRFVFTDQVLYAKLFLATPVFVADGCWDKYRQHSTSSGFVAQKTGRSLAAEIAYLDWLAEYLRARGLEGSEVWRAMASYRYWRHGYPRVYKLMMRGKALLNKVRATLPGSGS
jgi:glycosyltransferase involved in cell wall biosynthesis